LRRWVRQSAVRAASLCRGVGHDLVQPVEALIQRRGRGLEQVGMFLGLGQTVGASGLAERGQPGSDLVFEPGRVSEAVEDGGDR
jgi:hypothetical protein